MKKLRFAIFGVVLAGAVTWAVSTVAQSPDEFHHFGLETQPFERARIMALDGRGSQIGVMVEDLTADDFKKLTGVTNGVRVQEVERESPASKADLREGDVVVDFDGERIRSARQFSRLVAESVGGRAVKLGLVRDGKRQTIDVTPETRAMAWGIDGDRIGREIARSMREIEPRMRELAPRFREMEPRLRELEPRLRELEPRLREFRANPPGFNFRFDDMLPGNVRGRLGVQIESLSPQLAEYFGVGDGGVLVSSVTSDSPAAKAGLRAGDVITSINGDRVRDYDDLMSELRSATGEVTIGIVRDKKESTVKATIEEVGPRMPRMRRPA